MAFLRLIDEVRIEMNDQLKMQPSWLLILTRIVVFGSILSLFAIALYGAIDPRTKEEKAADYRKELLADYRAQAAIEGIRAAYRKSITANVEAVYVLHGRGEVYVAVAAKDSLGNYEYTYFDAKNDKVITSHEYSKISNAIASYHNFVGKKNDMETTYEGADLQILCEEARS